MVTFDPTGGWRRLANVHHEVNYVPTGKQDDYTVIAAHIGDLTRDVMSEAAR